jgi:hypothetical protein
MNCKKLVIETNGTTAGTFILVDGEKIGRIQRLEFSADLNSPFIKVSMEQTRVGADGKAIVKKQKIRDEKTQKFEDREIVATEAISIVFEK